MTDKLSNAIAQFLRLKHLFCLRDSRLAEFAGQQLVDRQGRELSGTMFIQRSYTKRQIVYEKLKINRSNHHND